MDNKKIVDNKNKNIIGQMLIIVSIITVIFIVLYVISLFTGGFLHSFSKGVLTCLLFVISLVIGITYSKNNK